MRRSGERRPLHTRARSEVRSARSASSNPGIAADVFVEMDAALDAMAEGNAAADAEATFERGAAGCRRRRARTLAAFDVAGTIADRASTRSRPPDRSPDPPQTAHAGPAIGTGEAAEVAAAARRGRRVPTRRRPARHRRGPVRTARERSSPRAGTSTWPALRAGGVPEAPATGGIVPGAPGRRRIGRGARWRAAAPVVVVANPTAGRGKAGKLIGKADAILRDLPGRARGARDGIGGRDGGHVPTTAAAGRRDRGGASAVTAPSRCAANGLLRDRAPRSRCSPPAPATTSPRRSAPGPFASAVAAARRTRSIGRDRRRPRACGRRRATLREHRRCGFRLRGERDGERDDRRTSAAPARTWRRWCKTSRRFTPARYDADDRRRGALARRDARGRRQRASRSVAA